MTVDERDQRLAEAVEALARSLREDRDRLARRLGQLERELAVLASKLDGSPALVTLRDFAPRRS